MSPAEKIVRTVVVNAVIAVLLRLAGADHRDQVEQAALAPGGSLIRAAARRGPRRQPRDLRRLERRLDQFEARLTERLDRR